MSVYIFKFHSSPDLYTPEFIQYSIDGTNSTQKLDNNSIAIKTKPEKHIFQFFYSENYHEVNSDSLEIEARHRGTYYVQFLTSQMIELTERPVI